MASSVLVGLSLLSSLPIFFSGISSGFLIRLMSVVTSRLDDRVDRTRFDAANSGSDNGIVFGTWGRVSSDTGQQWRVYRPPIFHHPRAIYRRVTPTRCP